ncbi:hypothetical protein [Crocosphaera sp. Alani8]|uniref:hypothetical protein n=1 Tax=Crocosphaera sp. Alani8 TaxID=3038952 RepID=UPI00313ED957
MLKPTFSSLIIVLAVLVMTPAYSQDIRTIAPGIASGESGSLPRLQVWPGSGLNISFSKTGEYIQKVWLDDPSRITTDFDAPISSGNAQSIHLKRINTLKFENLPTSPSTLLTVITNKNRYQFVLTYGKGNPQYYGVTVAQPKPSPTTRNIPGRLGGADTITSLRMGMLKALNEGLISPNQGNMVLVTRVNNVLRLVSTGRTLDEAAGLSGVSPQFLARLSSMGQTERFRQQLESNYSTSEPLNNSILELFYPKQRELLFEDKLNQ